MEVTDRLEAATSRLEDMAMAGMDPAATLAAANGVPPSSAAQPAKGSAGSGVAAGGVGVVSGGGKAAPPPPPPPKPAEPLPASISAFDQLISTDVTKFFKLGEELGGVLAEQVRGGAGAYSFTPVFLSLFSPFYFGMKVFPANSSSSIA